MTVEHFLLTIPLTANMHCHAYLMTTNEQDAQRIASKMIESAEEYGLWAWPPVVLMTELSTGVEQVREILLAQEGAEEVRRSLNEATTFHVSIWLMRADTPDDERLMELH
jgi:hypothetical protein